MKQFIWGVLTIETAAAALFFFRYWWLSGERLFAYFALSFATLALNWLTVSLIDPRLEASHWAYLLRSAAFLLIIVGIVDKNRGTDRA